MRSSRPASTIWRSFPVMLLRGVFARIRTNCIVIVEPPNSGLRPRRSSQLARAIADQSTPP